MTVEPDDLLMRVEECYRLRSREIQALAEVIHNPAHDFEVRLLIDAESEVRAVALGRRGPDCKGKDLRMGFDVRRDVLTVPTFVRPGLDSARRSAATRTSSTSPRPFGYPSKHT